MIEEEFNSIEFSEPTYPTGFDAELLDIVKKLSSLRIDASQKPIGFYVCQVSIDNDGKKHAWFTTNAKTNKDFIKLSRYLSTLHQNKGDSQDGYIPIDRSTDI